MRTLIVIVVLLLAGTAAAKTCRKGCACGNTCISCSDTCHQGGSNDPPSTAPSGGGCATTCCGAVVLPLAFGLRRLRRT